MSNLLLVKVVVVMGINKIVVFFALGSGAHQSYAQTNNIEQIKTPQDRKLFLSASAGIGAGSFQDIQVPENKPKNPILESNTPKNEVRKHSGIPLLIELDLHKKISFLEFRTSFDFVHLTVNKQEEAEISTASYGKVELGESLYVAYSNPMLKTGLYSGGFWRRSSFYNFSSGHSFDSTLVRGGAFIDFFDIGMIDLNMTKSIDSKMNYNQGSFFNQKAIKNSQAELQELNAKIAYNIDRKLKIWFNAVQETIVARIDDIETYNEFGLSIFTLQKESREYSLTTDAFMIGFTKDL